MKKWRYNFKDHKVIYSLFLVAILSVVIFGNYKIKAGEVKASEKTVEKPKLATNFDQCQAMGGEIFKTYPLKCVDNNSGLVFLKKIINSGTMEGNLTFSKKCYLVDKYQICSRPILYTSYKIYIYPEGQDKSVTSFNANKATGHYKLDLEEGNYLIKIKPKGGEKTLAGNFTIKQGETTTFDINK